MIKLKQVQSFVLVVAGLFLCVFNIQAQEIPGNIINKFQYRSIGPTRQGGRIVDFAVPSQQPYTFYVATGSGGLWKTVNNGLTYVPIFDHEHSIAIGDVAVAPSEPDIVWVGTGEANGDYWGDGMYKSVDGGATWTNMGLRESHYIGRIRIHPKNPDIDYVAATGHFNSQNPERGVYKTMDGGKNWTKSLEIFREGRHVGAIDLVMDPRDADVLYAASYDRPGGGRHSDDMGENSSGIYKTEDGGVTWSQLTNGLPLEDVGRIGLDVYLRNPDTLYAVMHDDSDVILQGANKLLRSPYRGETWEEISPDLTRADENSEVKSRRGKGTITTIDESPVVAGVIWVGTDDGNVQLTRDGGKSWEKLNDRIPRDPGHKVSRVTASFHAAGTAYVTFTGRGRDDFRPYVYKTSDFGQTWMSIASNLPDEPVNVIKEDRKNPNLLFLGNDKAVYVSIDGGALWTCMKNNMPTQPIHDLVLHPRENDLVVGTYGRGFFITDISPLQELTPEVLTEDAHLFEIEPKVQWVIPREKMVSSQNYAGENEPYGVIVNYYLKKDIESDVTIDVFQGERKIRTLKGPVTAGLNQVEWRMNTLRELTAEEKEQFQEELEWYLIEPYTKFQQVDYHDVSFDPNDPDHLGVQVSPGEYTVKITVNGNMMSRKAVILQDHWYTKYY